MAGGTKMVIPFLFLLLALTTATPAPSPFVPICDKTRYKNLGLDVSDYPFCDTSLTFAERAKNLVAYMTLSEKAGQLGNFAERAKNLVAYMTLSEKAGQLGNGASGVERIGIPYYNWWSEALHGVSNFGGGMVKFTDKIPGATSFPMPITTGAAFNETLWKAIGQAVSTEARAMYNLGSAGMTFWSPNINIVRDPRWGRSMETPGEDPFHVGRYAVNYVRGLQDVEGHETAEDPNARPLKVSACCKHMAAYDLDYWFGPGKGLYQRLTFNANVTEQDMVETFLRPFEMCVKEGDVSSVMCSYNEINAIPACADARLMRGTIRNDWNLHGYIVSDCDSVEVATDNQKFLDDTPEDSVAQTLRAGLDMDCGDFYPKHLESAVRKGLVKESDVDQALINNYMVLFRTGYFDGNPMFSSLGASDVCSKDHIELAVDAARQGMVLLKNKALPLSTKNITTVALVGPNANATDVMIGNYAGIPCKYVSPLDGFSSYAKVDYKMGCADVLCKNETLIWPAVQAAQAADATIIIVGLDKAVEAESLDRENLELPGYQNQFIRQVASVSRGPVVLVVMSGGGVDIATFNKSDDIDAILWAGYPGEQGGQAIADIVFGKYNPGGRLPLTWYHSDYVWNMPMFSMRLRPVDELGYLGRTYKFFNGSTIYPFGYGLSYTQFSYNVASTQKFVEKRLAFNQHCVMLKYNQTAYVPPCQAALVDSLSCEDKDITIDIQVTNTGTADGSDVVMLFSQPPEGIIGAPIKQLIGFQRVFVAAGASETVKFKLSSCNTLSIVTQSAYLALPEGVHTIIVGVGSNAIDFPFHVYLKN